MPDTTKKMEVVYKSTMINFRKVAFPIFLLVAGLLIETVYKLIRHPHNPEQFSEACIRIPVGLALVGLTLFIYHDNHKRTLRFGPNSLTCTHGEHKVTMLYTDIKVLGPKGGSKRNRGLTVTDGHNVFRVEEFFFKQFDEVVKEFAERKAHTIEHLV